MLSIIISSYQPEYFTALENNIAETCGIPYEIIKIDNPGIMGICEAYNKVAEKAQFEYLLFIHEDIEFISKNWGTNLCNYLINPDVGVIGLAGSNYVPNVPCGWHTDERYMFRNLIQSDKTRNTSKQRKSPLQEVYSLDGVFLAIRFHAYDIDFSIRVSAKYKNFVIPDIAIQHFSEGGFSKDLIESRIEARKHYTLPQKQKTDFLTENKAFEIFLREMKKVNIDEKQYWRTALHYCNIKYLGIKGFISGINKIYYYYKK